MGLSTSVYRSILEAYQLNDKNYSPTELAQGLINDTYILSEDGREKFLLQRINTEVFKEVAAMHLNQLKALKSLKSINSAYPQLLSTREGNSFFVDREHNSWRVSEFAKNSKAYDSSQNTQMAFEAGSILAEFHNALQGEDPNSYEVHLPKFNDLNYRFEEFDTAYQNASTERIEASKELLSFIELLKPQLTKNNLKLPVRVCHNDTKLNNLLFRDQKALCLIDLDTLMPGYLFYDFGDLFRTAAFDAKEGELNLEQIKLNKEYSQSLIKGFITNLNTYNSDEQKSLSLGAVYMPFIHGLRALTDFYLNDIHYKVTYPTENLDRAKSLFRFAKEAYKNNAFIDKCIKESSTLN